MKKYKAYLTMEFTADVQASDEDSARDTLAEFIQNGYKPFYSPAISNIEVKRYWGGGNVILDDGTVVVR